MMSADHDREEVQLGDYIELSAHRMGQVKYVGQIHGKKGIFYGVEVWKGAGKHSGTFEGVEYFECDNPGMGVFVIPKAILYILDVPKDYNPFKQLRLKREAQQRKKDERDAKYGNNNKKGKKYKSNNKQSKKPNTASNSKSNKNKVVSSPKPNNKESKKPKTASKANANSKSAQQATASKYTEAPKQQKRTVNRGKEEKKKNNYKSKNTYGRDKSDTIMSVKEFKSIKLTHLLGKGDNFDIAKRICKFYDELFNDTDTVCLVSNMGLKPSYSYSVEDNYIRNQTFNREGKYIIVYRGNPHTEATCLVSKQCFKSVVKGLAMDIDNLDTVLMNLTKLFGDGCHVVKSKKICFDIYSRFSDGYECELRLPNGGDYVLAWRR